MKVVCTYVYVCPCLYTVHPLSAFGAILEEAFKILKERQIIMSQISALVSKVQKQSVKYSSSVWRKRCRSTVTLTKEEARRLYPQAGCGLPGEAGGLVLYLSEKD